MKLVRLNVMWSEVEAQQGKDDWSGYDPVMNGLKAHGIEAVLTLVHDAGLGQRREADQLRADERRHVRRFRANAAACTTRGSSAG